MRNPKTLHRLLLLLLIPMGLVAWRLAYEPDWVEEAPDRFPFTNNSFVASFANANDVAIFSWERGVYPAIMGDPIFFGPRIHQVIIKLDTGDRHWITKSDFDSTGNFTWERHPRLRSLMPGEDERIIRGLFASHQPSKTGRIFQKGQFAIETKFLAADQNNPFSWFDGYELVELNPSDPRTVESRERIAHQLKVNRDGKYFVGWTPLPASKAGSVSSTYSVLLRSIDSPRIDIANWTSGSTPLLADDKVISLASDKKSTEIRNALDGSLVNRIDHETFVKFAQVNPMAIYPDKNRILFRCISPRTSASRNAPAHTLLFDYEKNVIVAQYEHWIVHYSFTRSTDPLVLLRSTTSKKMRVIDIVTGEVVYENDYKTLGSRNFQLDRDCMHLMVARPDCTVHLIDLATGSIVRRIGEQTWRFPVFIGLLVAFGIWCGVWLSTGSPTAPARTFDLLVIQMAVFCYAVMDQQLAGVVNSLERADLPLAFGILSGWAFLVATWTVWGNATRFVKLVTSTVAGVAFVMGTAPILFVSHDLAAIQWLTLFPFTIFTTLSISAFSRKRIVASRRTHEIKSQDKKFQLKIVELLAITVIAAFLCVTPWRFYSSYQWTNIFIGIGCWSIYCLGLGFLMLRWALGSLDWRRKAIIGAVGLSLWGATILLIVTLFYPNKNEAIELCRSAAYFHLAFTITVMTIFDVYRLSDWRLVHAEH